MATYTELYGLFNDDSLRNRTEVAVVKAAHNLITGTPTTADQEWAGRVVANTRSEAEKALMFVLAANSDASLATINAATDAQLLTNVEAVVPTLVVARGS